MRIPPPPPPREEENSCFTCRNSININMNMEDGLYILMVQHLIEKCLLFNMDRHECVQTLAKKARIHPLITLAVWKGLLRENRDFFRTYFIGRSQIYNAQIHSIDPTYYMRHCRRK